MIRTSTKPVRADAAMLRPVLIVAVALWVTCAACLFVLVLCCRSGFVLPAGPLLALSSGFSAYQALQMTSRYRQAVPLHGRAPR